MAAADPASRNRRDSPLPLKLGIPFQRAAWCGTYFLFVGLFVCSCQANRHRDTGGPIPAPLLHVTVNVKDNALMLPAGHSLPTKQIHLLLRFHHSWGFSPPFLEGENKKQ